MISQTLEYALRAVVYLAGQKGDPKTAEVIAEATHVPLAYLSKILRNLVANGLIQSRRGLHGGFMLIPPPEKLAVLDVVNAVEPIQRIRTCPLGLAAHGVRLCPLHRRLDDAMNMVEQAFAKTTIAEILSEPTDSIPLCDFPPPPVKTRSDCATS